MTDRELLCKEFTELTGGKWHYKVGECYCHCGASIWDTRHFEDHIRQQNPTYDNPADVLRSIIKSGLYNEFMVQYGGLSKFGRHLDSILVDLIIEQDALLKEAVEFLRGV